LKSVDRMYGISDPLLAAAMDELRGDQPVQVDWDRLRSSINERAALPLARKRGRRATVLARPLPRLAIAASVAFALWIGPGVYQDVFGPPVLASVAAPVVDHDELLVQALGGELSEHEFRLLVTGRANPEVLLAVAIGAR
jgi:hypothetical protein